MFKKIMKRLEHLLKFTLLVFLFTLILVLVVSLKSCNKNTTRRKKHQTVSSETKVFPTMETPRFFDEYEKNDIELPDETSRFFDDCEKNDIELPEVTPPPIETRAEQSEEVHEDGFEQVGDTWYYYKDNNMITDDWIEEDGGRLYYFLSDGKMATGWVTSGEDEYCFYSSGPRIGILIRNDWSIPRTDGSFSYMGEDGRILKNTVKDGYIIDSNGIAH